MTLEQKRFGMLINLDKCVGCYACQVTCKAEYNTSFGTFRCRVEQHSRGVFPGISKFFLPRLCNHCDDPPCIRGCEEHALSKNNDGVVLLNHESCTGCGTCFDVCPYNAIMIDQFSGEPEKCDFCYRRITRGELPVCVMSCMGKAILFGDMRDEMSAISIALNESRLKVLNPELGTHPSVFYTFAGDCGGSSLKDYDLSGRPPAPRTASVQSVASGEAAVSKTRMIQTADVMCPSECGISVLVEDSIAKKIYGNRHSLVNNGAFCAKGASGLQLTYSPHRIRSPLIREGARGEERWREITWEEAGDYLASRLIAIKRRYGPESVILDLGDVTDREAYYRIFHAFGTPNTYNHGSICDPNRKWGQGIMLGDERPLPDLQRPFLSRKKNGDTYLHTEHDARLLLNIGANPFVSTRFNYMSYGISGAREDRDCTYIVVDPSFSNSAARADMWLSILPGSDAAFLAAMLSYLIRNDSKDSHKTTYIDHEFIRRYTTGWEEFQDAFLGYTRQRDPSNSLFYFSAEWAEEKTGISGKDIEHVSHLFGITKPAAIEIGMHGSSHHTNGDVASILMSALCLITGNIDIPGGLVFTDSQKAKRGASTSGKEFLERSVTRRIAGRDVRGKLSELHKDSFGDYPASWKGALTDLPEKIRNGVTLRHGPFRGYRYPLKAFIARAGNPVITAGSTPDWVEALTARDDTDGYRLELMAFIDTHISVTGKYADIVLPEAGFLERMGVSDVYTMSPEIAIRDRVIEPLHKSKTPYEFMISLSDALILNGDTEIRSADFRDRYRDEEDFINEILGEAPGFYNLGDPLPYPQFPEGCLIIGTPDNPSATLGDEVIRSGEPLTVDWLRRHNGVAIWPAGYYRYKKSDGSPSGIYPNTSSKRFEFRFSHIDKVNKKFGTDFPATFYWTECRWNPKNPEFQEFSSEYPFQLITGRVHHAMTMTSVCPQLGETETECMKPLNEAFSYRMPETGGTPNTFGVPEDRDIPFREGSVSIPVLAVNRADGEALGIKTGDMITLQNPLKKRIQGKAYLTEEIMPGVIKTAFGPGGQKASGVGFMNNTAGYTPNINELHDPQNINPFTGAPGFGDIMVNVIRQGSGKRAKGKD